MKLYLYSVDVQGLASGAHLVGPLMTASLMQGVLSAGRFSEHQKRGKGRRSLQVSQLVSRCNTISEIGACRQQQQPQQ